MSKPEPTAEFTFTPEDARRAPEDEAASSNAI
jgi:hypothetical protein